MRSHQRDLNQPASLGAELRAAAFPPGPDIDLGPAIMGVGGEGAAEEPDATEYNPPPPTRPVRAPATGAGLDPGAGEAFDPETRDAI